MKHVAAFPGTAGGSHTTWPQPAGRALASFLNGLEFTPTRMDVWLNSSIYAAARVLGLEVPLSRGEAGHVAVGEGGQVAYEWGTIDGRATEWLRLSAPYDQAALQALVQRFSQAFELRHRSDLEVILSAPLER